MSKQFHTLLVCQNGHINNRRHEVDTHLNRPFCQNCGTTNIHQCPLCHADIPGTEVKEDETFDLTLSTALGIPPKHCANCGKAYPWSEQH